MTTKKEIRLLAQRLAVLTAQPLILDVHNPGDYTRYRLMTPSGSGESERPHGSHSYKAAEMEIYLRACLNTAESLIDQPTQDTRMRPFYAARNATK